jgi:Fe-S-cluster containining protein
MPLKQLVPEEFCLRCDVCCRFPELHTVWSPLFTESEIKHLVEKDILPPLLFTLPPDSLPKNKTKQHKTQRIDLITHKDYFICPCFNSDDSKCKIYANRPFECVLYPFLLVRKGKKSYLAIDKKCPYIENLNQGEIKSYADYLKKELNKKSIKSFLENNPELFAEYPATDLKLLFSIN